MTIITTNRLISIEGIATPTSGKITTTSTRMITSAIRADVILAMILYTHGIRYYYLSIYISQYHVLLMLEYVLGIGAVLNAGLVLFALKYTKGRKLELKLSSVSSKNG